jgi:hypothetical protein
MSDDILWEAHPGPQTEALMWKVFELLYGGARGGGKTDAGLAWLEHQTDHPLMRQLVIRKNADDLSDWIERARVMFTSMGATFTGKPAVIKWPSGAITRCGHLKDDNAYEKYQGHEYQRILIEELTQIPTEERYLKLLSSCRSTVKELKPRAFLTTNPGGAGHLWVKERFIDVAAPQTLFKDPVTGRGRIFIPAKVEDNPTLLENDPNYVAFLEGLPENLRKAWREGDWNIFAGQYFQEWNEQKHIVQPFKIPDTWKKYRTIDYGRTAPFACYWVAVDYDNNAWVYREYYEDGKDADENAQKVVELSESDSKVLGRQYEYSILDSSCWAETGHGESIANLISRVTKGRLDCLKSPKDRVSGWTVMHQYMRYSKESPPKLRFFNTCHNAIRTIPSLIHDERHPEDLDTDGEDHAADAIRYLLQTFRGTKSKKPLSHIQKLLKERQEEGRGFSQRFYEQ